MNNQYIQIPKNKYYSTCAKKNFGLMFMWFINNKEHKAIYWIDEDVRR